MTHTQSIIKSGKYTINKGQVWLVRYDSSKTESIRSSDWNYTIWRYVSASILVWSLFISYGRLKLAHLLSLDSLLSLNEFCRKTLDTVMHQKFFYKMNIYIKQSDRGRKYIFSFSNFPMVPEISFNFESSYILSHYSTPIAVISFKVQSWVQTVILKIRRVKIKKSNLPLNVNECH